MSKPGLQISALERLPNLLAMHAGDPQYYPFLLESAATGGSRGHTLGRYDILFCRPGAQLTLTAEQLASGLAGDFLAELDEAVACGPTFDAQTALPFRGGWFVFLGYELAAQVEPTLRLPMRDDFPVAFAVRIVSAIVIDRAKNQAWLLSEDGDTARILHDANASSDLCDDHQQRAIVTDLREEDPAKYLAAVTSAQRHIIDGDVFQANLSRVWRAKLLDDVDDARIYRRLRTTNPGPFAGLARWRDSAIISSSPERLVRVREGKIETRPIAGTRPRGLGLAEDQALSAELLAHPKERAEHVMLIDLERNDLGRVCQPGSVQVDELMVIESYAHVHHIVSNVCGNLRSGVGIGDALRAVFPGGTITGCPKVRCMQLIADLEGEARGPYTGAMGYVNHDGSGDFNILIRTLVRTGRNLELRAGAGIVADSVAQHELAETRAKARGLLLALGVQAEEQ